MNEPVWLSVELIERLHDRQLAEHGGPAGVRDRGMLESALGRPRQKFSYGGLDIDLPVLAAAYAFGLARNHPFVDGNKRTAAVACELFLELNDHRLVAADEDLYPVFTALAAGELSEDQLAEWLRRHSRPEQVSEGVETYTC